MVYVLLRLNNVNALKKKKRLNKENIKQKNVKTPAGYGNFSGGHEKRLHALIWLERCLMCCVVSITDVCTTTNQKINLRDGLRGRCLLKVAHVLI